MRCKVSDAQLFPPLFPSICTENAQAHQHDRTRSRSASRRLEVARLQLISHLLALGPNHSAEEEDGIGPVVLHQEDEGMVHVEELGILHLVRAEDAVVCGVAVRAPLHGRSVEHVGQVEVLLPGDVGQVCLAFVHSLSQTQLSKVFLHIKKIGILVKYINSISMI